VIEALIVAVIIIAVVFAIAHLIARFTPIPGEIVWLVYLIAALISILVLWRVIAPLLGPLP
jgi:uncharacterized RDD family membrane protein YckC